jgi:hypothetical protein
VKKQFRERESIPETLRERERKREDERVKTREDSSSTLNSSGAYI